MPQACSIKLPIAQRMLFSAAFLVLAGGCGIEPDTLDSITEVIHRGAGSGMNLRADTSSDLFSSGDGEASNEGFSKDGDPSFSGSHSFEPLYPERANPFSYPTEVDSNSATATGASVAEIQVMGFANVQENSGLGNSVAESKVLLKTNAGIKLLAVGEQVGQIKVLRIDSPTVELKMGSLIWTATMFDR